MWARSKKEILCAQIRRIKQLIPVGSMRVKTEGAEESDGEGGGIARG